jgi:hypothetical protein
MGTDETQIFSKDHSFIFDTLAAKVDQIAKLDASAAKFV